MKLILVNRYFHPDISATSRLATDLAVAQAARGREVHVVTGRQLYEDAGAALPAEETHSGVHIHRVRTTRFGRHGIGRALDYLTFYAAASACLARLARAGDVIVAKTDPPMMSVAAAWVARLRRAALVNWLQDVFPEVAARLGVGAARGLPGVLARKLRDRSLAAAAVNVAVGERMAEWITRAAPRARVEVIPNWADGTRVRPLVEGAGAVRDSWGLGERFVVAYSGNMGRVHDFETLLDACEALRADPGIAFVFVGGGSRRDWIEGEVRRRALGNVTLRPYQAEALLPQSLAAADAHLVTLRPELEGLVVPSKFYGIAAAGRPAVFVGDRDGEIARVIERERCGHVIERGDAPGLAQALRAMRDDPARTREMGARARAAFERDFDRPVALARWDRVLAGLA